MKYETRLLLFLIIILVCILGIFSKDILFKKTFVEGARTLPRPTRHPYIDRDELLGERPDILPKSINQLVDDTIGLYFDENDVPYMNTIQLYKTMCVSQGFTTDENKMRLNSYANFFFFLFNEEHFSILINAIDSCNSCVLYPCIFNNKLDLFEHTCFIIAG